MYKKLYLIIATTFIVMSCNQPTITMEENIKTVNEENNWKSNLEEKLKVYGHRNWIVVADGAYPQQSNPAIETITIDATQLEAVAFVKQLVEKATHVDANIFIDKELAFIPEKNANGIELYRNNLTKLFEGKPTKTMLHEDIIQELDKSANLFNVLILKTDLAIPYTSVFFQLECGYWNSDSENELREALK